jgi:hypothetical protein
VIDLNIAFFKGFASEVLANNVRIKVVIKNLGSSGGGV